MIVVTGGAGFIGSNIVHALNAHGRKDIMVVDNLTNGHKFENISTCTIADYIDKSHYLDLIRNEQGFSEPIDAIFHMGACSATTEWDGKYMLQNNYEYSKALLHYCLEKGCQFIYASSASVYGAGRNFYESPSCECPLNVYAYSKLLFDQYVRRLLPKTKTQIVGLRYFNVYGPRECHKGTMASMAYHLFNQLNEVKICRLFEGSGGFDDGEQVRDFVYVDDCVDVNLWFFEHPDRSGIFNVGTGKAQSFNDVARAAIAGYGSGRIEYTLFPEHLKGCYQSFTQADVSALRSAGYYRAFRNVESGVSDYFAWLHEERR